MKIPAMGRLSPSRPVFALGSAKRRGGRTLTSIPRVTTMAPSMIVLTGSQRLTRRVMRSWKQTIMIGLARV